MRNSVKNAITIFFILVGIVGMYYILREYKLADILYVYRHFNFLILAIYFCVIFSLNCVLTWRWDVILKSRNIKVPFFKLLVYRIIGTAINFITPGPRVGGEPTQATLLTKHGPEFTEGLSTIMIDKIIDVTTSGLLFLIGLFLVGVKYSFPRNAEIPLFIGGVIFVGLIGTFYARMLTSKHFFLHIFRFFGLGKTKIRWLNTLEKNIERIELIMIEFYKHNKKAFLKSLGISVISWVLMFVEYKLATTLLGINIGVAEIFFIVSFIGMAMLFPIPMAVGVLEAGQLSAFALINLSANTAIALAFFVRMKDILIAIIGFILLTTYGFHIGKVVENKYRVKKEKKESLR